MKNGTLIQYFHWHTPAGGQLWKQVKNEAKRLAAMGINALWLPPASKGASGADSRGYDTYDLYDLGEFDQKGTVATRYGTREELLEAIKAIHEAGMQVYADIVLNHLIGADETEKTKVRKVDAENRNEFTSDAFETDTHTRFTYPGRKGKYSQFVWTNQCFSGIDCEEENGECCIYSIQNEYGELWEDVVGDEKGNFDYLMGADIDFRNPAVRDELKRWGEWLLQTTQIDGFRLDAAKHITPGFFKDWLDHMRTFTKKELFAVGEYWAPEQLDTMLAFIEATEGKLSLFDAPLHSNLYHASKSGKEYDLRNIFNNTLLQAKPFLAVTVVGNHDTQPGQIMEATLQDWFKPLAYALILLREQGYPCVFYPDLYGAAYDDVKLEPVPGLDKLITARDKYAYGAQRDYFEEPNCIGWTREEGCAVVLSNGDAGSRHMEIGQRHAGKQFADLLGKQTDRVTIDDKGWATFTCSPGSVSVWVQADLL